MTSFSTGTKVIPLIVIGSVLVVSIIAVLFTQAQVDRASKDVIEAKKNKLSGIASELELRLQDATRILEIAAKRDEVRNVLYASYVSEQFMGIPPDVDLEKRRAVRDVLATYPDFETIGFILPNGDIYFVEPYAAQQNLPRLNFAFREWYQGVISTQASYIGEAVVSAATGHRVVPIAVPARSNDDTLTGILTSGLDLHAVQQKLGESKLGTNEYILIADHNGNLVADSREQQSISKELRSVIHIEGVKRALDDGSSGSYTETIDGAKMFAYYGPISAGSHRWAIISLQPYDDAFFAVNTISYQSFTTIVSVVLVSAISGYFLYKSFQSNISLTRRLEKVNDDLKAQAEKLLEVDKEKEEFSAMITHELKTPLVPVIGHSELLLDGTLGELTQEQRESIQEIYDSASSLSSLISDLLDSRKLELGKMKFEMVENVSAKGMMEQCVNSFKITGQKKDITISYRIESDGKLTLKCDPKRINQVLNNLLSNAAKFVPEHTGKIEVSAKRDLQDGSVVFAVKDNGVGIPKDKQNGLFKKFYQADSSLSRNVGGTGLGLAISKGIVEAHHGRIWFESAPGIGSTFYFSIPSPMVKEETTK